MMVLVKMVKMIFRMLGVIVHLASYIIGAIGFFYLAIVLVIGFFQLFGWYTDIQLGKPFVEALKFIALWMVTLIISLVFVALGLERE
jgi:hypothetical protein